MKGYDYWSYRPYRPLLTNVGDVYICRLAPGEDYIQVDWLAEEGTSYDVYCRQRGVEEFVLAATVCGNTCRLENLQANTDYELFVQTGARRSLVRLARTGKVEGVVVNYLHPEDEAYVFSGRFLGSPSLVRHPDGHLLASMDIFRGSHPMNLTLLYRSDDDGKSWRYVCELMPCEFAKLFVHKGKLYALGLSTDYGDLLIARSEDGGNTFCAPVCLLRGSNGKKGNVGVHKNPQPLVYHKGRLYGTLEWGNWANKDYGHAAMVMSIDENDDLMVPGNWSFTEPRPFGVFAPELEGKPGNTMTIEGTLAVDPHGQLLNIMRYEQYEKALVYRVNDTDPEAQLTYERLMHFPANLSKFMIKYDEVSGYYYSVANYYTVDPEHYDLDKQDTRNCQSLLRSKDLVAWEIVKHLLDYRHEDPDLVGVQYADFSIEGDDIIYLSRTAINGARSFHDANYSVFHRVRDFRKLTPCDHE